MKNLLLKTSLSLGISLIFLTSTVGCRNSTSFGPKAGDIKNVTNKDVKAEEEVKKQPVKVKYPTYRVGAHVSATSEKKLLDEFKAKYGSEVELVVEEIPSDQTYVDKIKILSAAGDLPDVVEGKNGINELLIKGNLAVPFDQYLDADAQWKAEIGDYAIEANTIKGECWSISNGAQLFGYFYNKELFDKAGVKVAETWEEFMFNCEKLKAVNITPLALMTGENSWTSNLILASIIGTSGEAGNAFMNTSYPKNYETPEIIAGLEKMKIMFKKYTTSDAVGAAYANAANHFFQGKVAMIANGPWMISDFSDSTKAAKGFAEKVAVAAYPGSGMFSSFEQGYMLCSKTDEAKDAAIKFIKFKTGAYAQQVMLEMNSVLPLTANIQPSDEFTKRNKLFMETVKLGESSKYKYKTLDTINYANVSDAWKTLYPELIFNRISAPEMAKKLSDIADKNN